MNLCALVLLGAAAALALLARACSRSSAAAAQAGCSCEQIERYLHLYQSIRRAAGRSSVSATFHPGDQRRLALWS